MQLPVNIPDILKIATNMQEVKTTPVHIAIYIDDSAPGALSAHVRSAFASAAEHTRVTIEYTEDATATVREGLDMVLFVAGTSDQIGADARKYRDAGVPAMVVTDSPAQTARIASEAGAPIPAADIVAPIKLESWVEVSILAKINLPIFNKKQPEIANNELPAGDNTADGSSAVVDPSTEVAVGDDASVGEIELDAEAFALLDMRMGKWIITSCKDKDLAFAYSFAFIRRPLAIESITATALENGAIGLVPFLPGADMPIMTMNQIKMALQIATAYGQEIDQERIKEIVAVIGGAFVSRNIVRSITKFVPGVGWVVSGAMGFGATEAIGRALLEYFEAGGDIVGVASVMQKARDKALELSKNFAASDVGQSVVAKAKDVAKGVISKNARSEQ